MHRAVRAVADRASARRSVAQTRLEALAVDVTETASLADALIESARLTLNFHPDRVDAFGRTVAEGLLADGRYRSQFETGLSGGQRSANPGGGRTAWESTLFGHAYDDTNEARPVYGALDLFADPYGGAPRFGSSFIVLQPHCLQRTTLCVGDSHLGPNDVGTLDEMTSIVAGSIEECSDGNGFGRRLDAGSFVERLTGTAVAEPSARELDRYIEAQVHGGIDLSADVAALMLDPSFRATEVERNLRTAASTHGFELSWSEGSEVLPKHIDPAFRGASMVPLARDAAGPAGVVDAAAIGRALQACDLPGPGVHGDDETSPFQQFKKLWHCCVHFGAGGAAATSVRRF